MDPLQRCAAIEWQAVNGIEVMEQVSSQTLPPLILEPDVTSNVAATLANGSLLLSPGSRLPHNKGLLPSVAFDTDFSTPRLPSDYMSDTSSTTDISSSPSPSVKSNDGIPIRQFRPGQRRYKWSDEETSDLFKGVAKFGIGQWSKILQCEEYHFKPRTRESLKHRFLVCCPEEYLGPFKHRVQTMPSPEASDSKTCRLTADQLRRLGFELPFKVCQRQSPIVFSPEEDKALLNAHRKHGLCWTAMSQDEEFARFFRGMTPKHLRDHFRSRYPKECKRAGLARASSPTSQRPRIPENRIARRERRRSLTSSPGVKAPDNMHNEAALPSLATITTGVWTPKFHDSQLRLPSLTELYPLCARSDTSYSPLRVR